MPHGHCPAWGSLLPRHLSLAPKTVLSQLKSSRSGWPVREGASPGYCELGMWPLCPSDPPGPKHAARAAHQILDPAAARVRGSSQAGLQCGALLPAARGPGGGTAPTASRQKRPAATSGTGILPQAPHTSHTLQARRSVQAGPQRPDQHLHNYTCAICTACPQGPGWTVTMSPQAAASHSLWKSRRDEV